MCVDAECPQHQFSIRCTCLWTSSYPKSGPTESKFCYFVSDWLLVEVHTHPWPQVLLKELKAVPMRLGKERGEAASWSLMENVFQLQEDHSPQHPHPGEEGPFIQEEQRGEEQCGSRLNLFLPTFWHVIIAHLFHAQTEQTELNSTNHLFPQ